MEKKKKGHVNEGKYLRKEKLFFVDEKEKEENIWRSKEYFWGGKGNGGDVRRKKSIFFVEENEKAGNI